MLSYSVQIYIISAIYISIQVEHCTTQENGTRKSAILRARAAEGKCSAKFCSCSDFEKLGNLSCSLDNHIFPKRFVIFLLSINDANITLDEDTFEAVDVLKILEVVQSSIQIVPDFSFVKDSIGIVIIESSRLTSLTGRNLQNLKKVEVLSFSRNFIEYIDPDVFQGTDNVDTLDLSYNRLTSIPPALLHPMKKLYRFSASHNNLWYKGVKFHVIFPKEIYLDHNNISDTDAVLLFPGTNRAFSPLEIYILDLSYNRIDDDMSTEIAYNAYLYYGWPFLTINELRLNGNQLRTAFSMLSKARIVNLQTSWNRIQFLGLDDFHHVGETDTLNLKENEIRWIHSDTFKPIKRTLNSLDLSCNEITSMNESLRFLSHLKLLNLSHNAIESLPGNEFEGLVELTEFYLQYNRIKTLGPLQHLNQLFILNIMHNNIETLRPENLTSSLQAYNAILFADNSIQCDCHFNLLSDWLRERSMNAHFDICLQSHRMHRKEKSKNCPELCLCRCTEDGMFVDCSSRNLSAVPQFFGIEKTQKEGYEIAPSNRLPVIMSQNVHSLFHVEDRVVGINLENNSLDFIDEAHLPPNLTRLYLANNELRSLPESIIDNQHLKQVSLSGNPWKCDCSAVKFRDWLTTKSDIIQDIDDVLCGMNDIGEVNLTGRVVRDLTYPELCQTIDTGLIATVSYGVLAFIILCLGTKIVYSKYEMNIKVFLYYHGCTFVKEEDIDCGKEFDAFISFSHLDDEFVVREFISVIEERAPDVRLCIHYRHFRAGEYILDNITRAVQCSKRTLLILSKNFLDSEWCLQEFRTAHTQTLEDKFHRIIIVKFGDLPKEIYPAIKVYLDNTTYLTWGERNFWEKLIFILPTRSNV